MVDIATRQLVIALFHLNSPCAIEGHFRHRGIGVRRNGIGIRISQTAARHHWIV